jgi:hypothetical protein
LERENIFFPDLSRKISLLFVSVLTGAEAEFLGSFGEINFNLEEVMISVTVLSGPYTGQSRIVSAEIKPEELFRSLLDHDWEWEVDYSQATETEKFLWFRQDLVCRCIRALKRGLPVRFMDRQFQGLERAGDLEDAIVGSGRNITLGRDDETGVEVVTAGWTQ